MSTLFDILDGIIESDEGSETLADTDLIVNYAEAAGENISYEDADKIQAAGRQWLADIENGNGEWSRMREEAKQALS